MNRELAAANGMLILGAPEDKLTPTSPPLLIDAASAGGGRKDLVEKLSSGSDCAFAFNVVNNKAGAKNARIRDLILIVYQGKIVRVIQRPRYIKNSKNKKNGPASHWSLAHLYA